MNQHSFIDKLKNRWGIESTLQVFIILIVFACTGFTALYVKKFFFSWIGVATDDPFWYRTTIWLLTVLPAYQVLLLIYGTIFGQFKFFWGFLKKTFGRFLPSKDSKQSSEVELAEADKS